MALRIAVKRLSAVETDLARSNQHEFHAGRLRQELDLPGTRWSGVLHVMIVGDAGEEPVVDESSFTLYDAREGSPTRAAEWHLYYASKAIGRHAKAGDLLVLFRHGDALRALIVRGGTSAESPLLHALALGDDAVRERFTYLDVPMPEQREVRQVAEQLALPDRGAPEPAYAATNHALFRRAIGEGRVPTTIDMALAASEIARQRGATTSDADAWLVAAMEAETELYFAIEGDVQQVRFDALAATNPLLTDIIEFAMSVQQSRRSRRGQSVQNHFATLLRDRGIPHSAQCETEPGERPDFLFPSCQEYHDKTVPAERLRMVACKSTAKERWRQVLIEAERIPEKYLLTVDPDLTSPVISAMVANRLVPFLPQLIIETAYAGHAGREHLGTIAALLERLEGLSGFPNA